MNFGHLATLLAFLVLFLEPCRAEAPNKIFQWQFSGNELSASLPSCRSFDITVKPFDPANDTHGIPPFYMQAFAIGGTPSTTLIGTDESNLSWTVNQPVGTKMLLTVIDSQGSTGGASTMLYTVTTGQSTQCIPPASNEPTFTVKANVSDSLTTCQPWGLTIAGGTPPYNVSLAATGQPVVTNVTMGPDDTVFTFIDRAPPGVQLVAAVSDLNGQWAFGTPIVSTTGSTDVNCTGLNSVSSTAAEISAQEEQAASAASQAQKKKSATIAVVVILVLLLFGGAGIFIYLRQRKMQRKAQEISPRQFENGPEHIDGPPPFQETGGHILSINSFITPPDSDSQHRSPTASSSPSNVSTSNRPRVVGNAGSTGSRSAMSAGMSIRNPDRPALNGFPTMSIRRSAKEIEAGLTTAHSVDSEYYDDPSESSSRPAIERSRSAVAPSTGLSPTPRYPARSASAGSPAPEIIFQHQDAGLVRELPPPYIDRGTRDS